MHINRFLLSFTATALLITPFAINAERVRVQALDDVLVAPGPGQKTVVNGLSFHSVIVKRDAKTATLQVKAKNDSDKPITTEVAASLMMMPSTSPMKRMVPPPRELALNKIRLSLAPGESVVKSITVKLPKDVTEQLTLAAKARAKAPANAAAPKNNAQAFLMASPPSFFAQIRQVQPAPTKAKIASAK